MINDLSERERYLARSALGLQYNDQKRSYRNGFVIPVGSDDFIVWCRMEDRGLAEGFVGNPHKMWCFRMTRLGAEAALRPGESLDPEDFPAATPATQVPADGDRP